MPGTVLSRCMPNNWKYLPVQKKRTVASYPTGTLLGYAGRHLMNYLMNHCRERWCPPVPRTQGKTCWCSRWPQLHATRKWTLFSSVRCRLVCNKSLPAAQQQNIVLCVWVTRGIEPKASDHSSPFERLSHAICHVAAQALNVQRSTSGLPRLTTLTCCQIETFRITCFKTT